MHVYVGTLVLIIQHVYESYHICLNTILKSILEVVYPFPFAEHPQQSAGGDLPVKRDQAGAVDGGDSLGKFESEGFGGQLEEKVHDLLEQSAEVKRKKVKKGGE